MQSISLEQPLSLRPIIQDDLPFLKQLYFTTRESELACMPFSIQEKNAFLEQQFSAQYSHYTSYYKTNSFYIIEYVNKPIGRWFIDCWQDEIRIVDISLMPDHQNKGIGSYLIKNLFKTANINSIPVTIHVDQNNPARQLYKRLGFKQKSKINEIYILMEWVPSLSD